MRTQRSLPLCVWLAAVLLGSTACWDDRTSTDDGVPASLPDVGDTVAWDTDLPPGEVMSVEAKAADCFAVTVQYPARWDCTQSSDASAGFSASAIVLDAGVSWEETVANTVTPYDVQDPVALKPLDCASVAQQRRPVVQSRYQQELSGTRTALLNANCRSQTHTYYLDASGAPNPDCDPLNDMVDYGYAASPTTGVMAMDGGSSGGSAAYYSTTNNQVAGVEEPDFVKNTGSHIYWLRADGLHVLAAWPVEDTHEVAFVPLKGTPRKMLLAEDYLVVYVSLEGVDDTAIAMDGAAAWQRECTYGYDCRFNALPGPTRMLVFDVSDPANPTEVDRIEFSGGLMTARRIGTFVYTVVADGPVLSLPGVDTTLEADSPEDLESLYEQRLKAVEQAVADAPDGYFLPWMVRSGDKAPSNACDGALVASAASGTFTISVVSYDVSRRDSVNRTVVEAHPGFVYASADALYIAADGSPDNASPSYYQYDVENDISTVHKFSLLDGATRYEGSHYVPGHVLNQFSMDEHNGVLRVATTNGRVPNAGVHSNVTTLADVGGAFTMVGSLSGLAPGEDIRAVRFDGDRAFIVTFKKTDPLFVIDLSDPQQPAVAGELKIPGFSTYMHLLDEDHILAVGFDAEDQGNFAYFSGIQIQIFDVADLTNPTLLHKMVIGTRGSGSEALLDHLAFNYFAPLSVLALPITVCEGGDANSGVYGDTLTFSGLMVFDISVQDGISQRGAMPFVDPQAVDDAAVCRTWWTDTTSLVKRSIFLEDYVFGLSDDVLKAAHIDSMDAVLATVSY